MEISVEELIKIIEAVKAEANPIHYVPFTQPEWPTAPDPYQPTWTCNSDPNSTPSQATS